MQRVSRLGRQAPPGLGPSTSHVMPTGTAQRLATPSHAAVARCSADSVATSAWCKPIQHRAATAVYASGPMTPAAILGPSPPTRHSKRPSATRTRHQRGCALSASSGNGHSSTVEASADVENVVIVGSGPAGYTAAIYAARANLKPVVFEGFRNGRGGQLMGTTEVENFPGFPEGITGPELMDRMRKQAERWGSELYTEDVDSIDLDRRPFVITTAERQVRAHTIIMATGATALKLGLPSEDTFWSKGISACAICDGASPLFKNRVVAVVGGGDSACEEAVYLTKYAQHVHLLVRKDVLRASKAMQDRTLANKNVTVHFNTAVEDVYGEQYMQGLRLINLKTGERSDLSASGLFYGIGHRPNSDLVSGKVEVDGKGYIKVQHGVSTNVDGVFSAGDLHDPEWRQAITAAGSGCMAALSVERYLSDHGLAREFKTTDREQQADAPEAAGVQQGAGAADEESFDLTKDKHRGQYALRKLYHSSDRLIAVLYTAPGCGPCRSLKPILNGVVDEYAGRVHYVEIDIEADPEIAEAAGVTGTPTLQLFKDKARLSSVPGVKLKREYRQLLEEGLQQQQEQEQEMQQAPERERSKVAA